MEKLTYRQAFDKITEAYIRGEIQPYDRSFCFCGTLVNKKNQDNVFLSDWDYSFYNHFELGKMEEALLKTIRDMTIGHKASPSIFVEDIINFDTIKLRESVFSHPNYENALFAGMSAALEVLKEIHRARGEDVDEVPMFTKRELLTP